MANMIDMTLCLKWPELGAIRTAPDEKTQLTAFIERVYREPYAERYRNFDKRLYPTELPISLCFLYNERKQVTDIILLLNKARGKEFEGGGQRRPKLAYELMRGRFCVKKTRTREEEGPIVNYLLQQSEDYLVNIIGKREIHGKHQYFETAYDCTLHHWIGTPRLQWYHNKLLVVWKLLVGLRNFQRMQVAAHRNFHNDLKLSNILVNGANELSITDFGLSNVIEKLCYSPYYCHPIKLSMRYWDNQEMTAYLMKLGAKLDMWSLGIVFVVVLTNRFGPQELPPLAFLTDIFSKKKHVVEAVTQDRIKTELLSLKKATESMYQGQILNPLWDIVIDMLQLNAENILSVEDALVRVNHLMKSSTKALGPCLEAAERCDALGKEMKELMERVRRY
jgi:hypothetical protein